MQTIKVNSYSEVPDKYTGIVEWTDGSKEWLVNGKLHRLDGPAREWASGSKEWWVNGKHHRLDGPAKEWADGSKAWWVDGKLHRLDGPAWEWDNGYKSWWVDDVKVTESEYPEAVRMYKIKLVCG